MSVKFDKTKTCPLLSTNHLVKGKPTLVKSQCIEHNCQFYQHLYGTDPQTGNAVDAYGCAIAWLPILTTEQTQKVNQLSADVQQFKNTLVVMAHHDPVKIDEAVNKLVEAEQLRLEQKKEATT